jgi:hypothetical protein
MKKVCKVVMIAANENIQHLSILFNEEVIASTDSSLNTKSIPQSFIDKYISEYNKGNKIEDVDVEYEAVPTEFDNPMSNPEGVDNEDSIYELKLNPDNTINIKSVKNSFTRKEVIALCFQSYNLRTEDSKVRSTKKMKEWIESNL